MKTLAILITAVFFVQTQLFAQDVRVQSIPQTGDQNYSSFYWLDDTSNQMETTLRETSEERNQQSMERREGTVEHREGTIGHRDDFNRSGMAFKKNKAIQDAILHEMVSRGFEIDPVNPDLLISYQIFDQNVEISGFIDDGSPVVGFGTQMPETIEVGEGTLFITVIHRETGEMISRGFLSEALTFDLDAREIEVETDISEDREQALAEHDTKKYKKKTEVIQAVSGIFERLQLGQSTLGAGR